MSETVKALTSDPWVQGWVDMNIRIWKEKLSETVYSDDLSPRRTGSLRDSLETLEDLSSAQAKAISYRFHAYGIYVDRGTGRERSLSNSGDIGMFRSDGKERRPRVAQRWFAYKWRRSVDRLVGKSAELTGRNTIHRVVRLLDSSV